MKVARDMLFVIGFFLLLCLGATLLGTVKPSENTLDRCAYYQKQGLLKDRDIE